MLLQSAWHQNAPDVCIKKKKFCFGQKHLCLDCIHLTFCPKPLKKSVFNLKRNKSRLEVQCSQIHSSVLMNYSVLGPCLKELQIGSVLLPWMSSSCTHSSLVVYQLWPVQSTYFIRLTFSPKEVKWLIFFCNLQEKDVFLLSFLLIFI